VAGTRHTHDGYALWRDVLRHSLGERLWPRGRSQRCVGEAALHRPGHPSHRGPAREAPPSPRRLIPSRPEAIYTLSRT
jgi:hypothetical protein